jgi:predicted PurR-regulated permease PerM
MREQEEATPGLSHDFERYAAIAAVVLLVIGCYLVVRPFVTAFLWGGILAISTYGLYARVLEALRQRRGLAAALTALSLTAGLLVPIAALGLNLADQWPAISARVNALLAGGVGQPPGWLEEIPLIGRSASAYWRSILADPSRLNQDLLPLLKPVREFLVGFVASAGSGILQFALALLIAGVLYARGDDFSAALDRVALRLGGETGHRQVKVVTSTVRGVFKGVLGTAAVQAIMFIFGFWLAGLPNVFMLGMGIFFLSVVPGGPALLWLPAALWLNAHGHAGWAIFISIWGLVAGNSDNLIRPLLIGKGVEAPSVLIFLGVIGGILAFGFLGLFIGPTLLAIAYNLSQDWTARVEGRDAAHVKSAAL